MSLNLGNTNINEIYMGSTKIGSAYLGSSLIYQSHKPATRVAFTKGTCSKQTLNFGSNFIRVQFMVLPVTNYTSQLGTCNDGIGIEYGISVFWVTDYTIDSDGALHVTGRKAAYDYSRASSSSGWPTLNSSTLYYYGSQSLGGVSSEAHKFGVGVPSDAVAVMLAYKNHPNSGITANTINTNRTYKGLQDACTGICKDNNVLNSIINIATNASASYDISASNMVYPLQSSRTILCGPREFLQSL